MALPPDNPPAEHHHASVHDAVLFEPVAPAPAAWSDADDDAEPLPAGGLGWRPLLWLSGLAVLALACALLLRSVVAGGMADQWKRAFYDVSLLPTSGLQQTPPELQLQIYYIVGGQALAPQTRRLRKPAGGLERVYLVARELENPPGGAFESPLPHGAKIRGLYILEGIVWVDLTGEFLNPALASPQSERLAIYSLVNSFMLNEPSLQGVRFMIDGRPVTSAWGYLDLSRPLGADLSLVR